MHLHFCLYGLWQITTTIMILSSSSYQEVESLDLHLFSGLTCVLFRPQECGRSEAV